MLQVRVAELDRTALRQIGADMLGVNPSHGQHLRHQHCGLDDHGLGIARPGRAHQHTPAAPAVAQHHRLRNFPQQQLRDPDPRPAAELVAHHHGRTQPRGHERIAGQLPGGRTVPRARLPGRHGIGQRRDRASGKTSACSSISFPMSWPTNRSGLTSIRIVSTIDTGLSTTLVAGGSPVPGLDTRQASTTVEMRQGQTLAIAGLLLGQRQRQHEPHSRPGRPALHRPVVQQHEPPADREGTARPGDPVSRGAHGAGPGALPAGRRYQGSHGPGVLFEESHRGAQGWQLSVHRELGHAVAVQARRSCWRRTTSPARSDFPNNRPMECRSDLARPSRPSDRRTCTATRGEVNHVKKT